jgi:two-component system response regulator DegU
MGHNKVSQTIRIAVVDDHPFFREGISRALESVPDFELIGEFDDGARGLKAIRHNHPDVAVLDVNLPTMNGLEVLKVIRDEKLATRVIVLTAHHDIEQTVHMIRAGAHAYAAKDIEPDRLIKVIRAVVNNAYVINGKRYTQDQVDEWIAEHVEDLSGPYIVDNEEHYIPLSPREMEILKYVTHGMSNQEVALALNISQQTVKNHMTSILRKLNVKDRTQAAVTAIRRGWVRIQK